MCTPIKKAEDKNRRRDPGRASGPCGLQRYFKWNWMFPLLITRCEVVSDTPPVTVTPN